jgi:hypothetical protein
MIAPKGRNGSSIWNDSPFCGADTKPVPKVSPSATLRTCALSSSIGLGSSGSTLMSAAP